MLATAVTSLYIPGPHTAGVINVCILLMLLIVMRRFCRYISWKLLGAPAIGMVLGKVLGILLLGTMSSSIFKKVLGLILLLCALYFFFMGDRISIRPSRFKGLVLGIMAGFIGGLYNISGPFMAIYYFPQIRDKNAYYATLNAAFVPAVIMGCITHISLGNLTVEELPLVVACLAAVALGTVVGVKLFMHVNRNIVARCLYGYTAAMGIFLILT